MYLALILSAFYEALRGIYEVVTMVQGQRHAGDRGAGRGGDGGVRAA